MSDKMFSNQTIAGSMVGFRSFRAFQQVPPGWSGPITSFGTNDGFAWQPGENLATCLIDQSASGRWPGWMPHPSHAVAQLKCSCGFYAYHKGAYSAAFPAYLRSAAVFNEHHVEYFQLGLIEGYGRVTVGDRGFRAQKARILCWMSEPFGVVTEAFPDVEYLSPDEAFIRFPLSEPPS